MTPKKTVIKDVFELRFSGGASSIVGTDDRGDLSSLPEPFLKSNVGWFCRLRWIVMGILVMFGILGQFKGIQNYFMIRNPGVWPFATAGFLVVGNVIFMVFARINQTARGTLVNLWSQIITDILVLTVVVHFVGSLETNITITYLLHIVLACIFFSRRSSLIVTLLVSTMYTICITAEHLGAIAPSSIFSVILFDRTQVIAGEVLFLNFLLAISIWLVVWYLASHLSALVRQRDTELAETNRRLVAAHEERSRHMLTTTHQLKAPFAAISTNAQLILKGYSGVISPETRDLVERIAARSRRLAGEIQEMLQLANLSSTSYKKLDWEKLDLAAVMRWCLGQVEPLALEKEITFCVELEPVSYEGVEDHLKMIFSNLLVNAVIYSHKGGQVKVDCHKINSSRTMVTIADEGIGIPAEKLPLIFNEHYRTNEAVQHNKESSGLGLSIVSRAAELHGIDIRVESEVGSGTTFCLLLLKEKHNGLSVDR